MFRVAVILCLIALRAAAQEGNTKQPPGCPDSDKLTDAYLKCNDDACRKQMQGQVNQISKKCPMVALLFQTVVTVDRQLRPQMDELAKAIERSLRQTSKHIIIQRISDKPVHPDLIMSFFREKYNPDGLCRQ